MAVHHPLTPVVVLLSIVVAGRVLADTENVVGLLSNYNQIVTSSTLRWMAASGGETPENAVVGAQSVLYTKNTTKDGSQEVVGTKTPVWVCRARASGMWVSGRLSPVNDRNSGHCIISMHGAVTSHNTYEVLQNIEDGGKLNWVRWDKYIVIPAGAVSGGPDPYLIYVARRKAPMTDANVTYHVGKLDPTRGLLGKIAVVEDDGLEHEYEEGEVLIETEPLKYEMDRVKFNMWRARFHREWVHLGAATLRNEDTPSNYAGEGDEVSRVDTVIAYQLNNTVSWGHGHGMLTGLPVTIRLANGTNMAAFKWAIDATTSGDSTYQIETYLDAGRAVNVSLVGNWTESNVPYTATVTAIYADGSRRSRIIMGSKREVGLMDVRPEFGPVYFLHNNSHVPTTTTTTTTTTTSTTSTTLRSTTTSTKFSTSTEIKPIPPSPMEEKPVKKGAVDVSSTKGENQSMMSDDPPRAEQKSNAHLTKALPILIFLLTVVQSCLLST